MFTHNRRKQFVAYMDGFGAEANSAEEWKTRAATLVEQKANEGDAPFNQLQTQLSPAGRGSEQYLNGVEAFFHTMGRSGDEQQAISDALYTAGLLPPVTAGRTSASPVSARDEEHIADRQPAKPAKGFFRDMVRPRRRH